MKKTYIEPANTVVKLNPVKMIAESPNGQVLIKRGGESIDNASLFGGREAIDNPDEFEEW